jgi:predicted membrane chloride channel (bestrophin family)
MYKIYRKDFVVLSVCISLCLGFKRLAHFGTWDTRKLYLQRQRCVWKQVKNLVEDNSSLS